MATKGVTYVSLMSTGWSGSTLVSMLIGGQPAVAGFGDTYFDSTNSPDHSCTCGVPFTACPERQLVQQYLRKHGEPRFSWRTAAPVPMPRWLPRRARQPWPLQKLPALPVLRALPDSIRRSFFRRFYRETRLMMCALREQGDYQTYLDGCKSLPRLELLRSEFPDIRALHVIRHPGAFLYHFARFGETSLDRRLRAWLRYHREARRFHALLGEHGYRLATYEDIVRAPGRFLREHADFLGLDMLRDVDSGDLDKDRVHVLGNRMRESATQVIDMSGQWRDRLNSRWTTAADRTVAGIPWLADRYPPV